MTMFASLVSIATKLAVQKNNTRVIVKLEETIMSVDTQETIYNLIPEIVPRRVKAPRYETARENDLKCLK